MLICSILLLGLDKQWGIRTYKNIILYFYSSMVTFVQSRRVFRDRVRTFEGAVKSQNSQQELTSAKILDLSLKTLTHACFSLVTAYTRALLGFHWSWLTPMQCLFFTGHSLHPHNACSPLVTAYTHALLVFQ